MQKTTAQLAWDAAAQNMLPERCLEWKGVALAGEHACSPIGTRTSAHTHTQNSCMREPPMAQGNQVAPHWIQLHTSKRLPKSTEQGLRQTPDQSSKRQDSQAGAPCMANGMIAFTVRTHARAHTRRTQKHTWRCMVGMREAGRSHSKRARPGTRTIQRWWLSTQRRPSLDEVRLRLFHQTYNAYVASA